MYKLQKLNLSQQQRAAFMDSTLDMDNIQQLTLLAQHRAGMRVRELEPVPAKCRCSIM